MKHSVKVTLILGFMFLVAQLVGLAIVNEYVGEKEVIDPQTGEMNITWEPLPSIAGVEMERPDVEPSHSVWMISIAIIIGTALLFVLIKLRKNFIWKLWFFLAIVVCLTVALNPFVGNTAAVVLAIIFGLMKLYRPGIITQNITEIFMYGGLAAIFVPLLNTSSAFVLLLLISAYDMYAVWQSKHMIKLAEFQTESKMFAGMMIPYNMPKGRVISEKEAKKSKKKVKTVKMKTAILGGGDIGFPLIFAGVIMKTSGFFLAAIIPLFTTAALLALLFYGKKDRFYPAMPFISLGCVLGFFVMKLVTLIHLL